MVRLDIRLQREGGVLNPDYGARWARKRGRRAAGRGGEFGELQPRAAEAEQETLRWAGS